MGDRIRVLIVDDHALFRSGVKSLLQRHQEFEVVDVAGDGLEGVKRAKFLKPDVVLLDLNMPGVPGIDALRLIVEEVPETHVLMLTVSEDAEDLLETLRVGTRAIWSRTSKPKRWSMPSAAPPRANRWFHRR